MYFDGYDKMTHDSMPRYGVYTEAWQIQLVKWSRLNCCFFLSLNQSYHVWMPVFVSATPIVSIKSGCQTPAWISRGNQLATLRSYNPATNECGDLGECNLAALLQCDLGKPEHSWFNKAVAKVHLWWHVSASQVLFHVLPYSSQILQVPLMYWSTCYRTLAESYKCLSSIVPRATVL